MKVLIHRWILATLTVVGCAVETDDLGEDERGDANLSAETQLPVDEDFVVRPMSPNEERAVILGETPIPVDDLELMSRRDFEEMALDLSASVDPQGACLNFSTRWMGVACSIYSCSSCKNYTIEQEQICVYGTWYETTTAQRLGACDICTC